MIAMNAESDRRFYRDADRAVLGGVCAGLAGYMGFNLRVTRCLAFIAFLMAMPIAVIGYLAAVFLIPSASSRELDVATERHFRRRHKSLRKKYTVAAPVPSRTDEINRRCEALDERLVRLERLVTSRRFQLEQELSRL